MLKMSFETLVERYRKKIRHAGLQSEHVNVVKQIINGNYPDEERLFSAEGIWAHERLLSARIPVQNLLICPECIYSEEAVKLLDSLLKIVKEAYIISRKVYERLSDRDNPDGFISIGRLPEHSADQILPGNNSVVVVLDGLEKPGNIGSIIRTCEGAGVQAVLICNKKTRITNVKLIKGSMGALFVIPVVCFPTAEECINWLEKWKYSIYLAVPGSENTYKSCSFPGRTALVLGNERHGISRTWYQYPFNKISIPMFGIGDSLNVAVAGSIILYEICMNSMAEMTRSPLPHQQPTCSKFDQEITL